MLSIANAIINHEESLTQLYKALCQIADVLSFVLYATQAMIDSVAHFYAHIVRFA